MLRVMVVRVVNVVRVVTELNMVIQVVNPIVIKLRYFPPDQ